MSFLYPAFLLGALAIALPVVLHLLRRDVAPEVPFSAVRLLRRSPIERSRRRRLRDLLLLAARVTALALLAVAFARPYFSAAASAASLRVVAIDRSFSMGAPGRFARAVELARAAIGEASVGDRVAVIAFDERADVIAAPGSAGDARSALATMSPGFAATRFAPAVAKAVEIAGGDPARLVVISDLQRTGWEDEQPLSVPSNLQVEVRDAGTPPPNAAVTHVRVEPDRVIASIVNSSPAAIGDIARIRIDGREVASTQIRVPPEGTVDVPIAYRAGSRGSLAVTIDDPKGYAADNIRFVVLDPPLRTRVMTVTNAAAPHSGAYFTRALEAAEEHPLDVTMVSGPELATLPAGQAARYTALALFSTRGLDGRARESVARFVRDGGGLLVFAGSDVEAPVLASIVGPSELRIADQHETVALSLSDVRHPVFRPFGPLAANLGQIRFDRTWRIEAKGWEVAARFTDASPALIERQLGAGRVMIFASDVDRQWNDFPLHPAFVPFVVESVRHIAGSTERDREYLIADAPSGVKPVPGVYQLGDGRRIAVNVDTRESAAASLTPQEFAEMLSRSPSEPARARQPGRAEQREARQNLWQYGLVLMLVVLVVESAVGRG
ncbi:MAG: BatA domain-containing protein [Vicinamibacterales bacterium]